MKLLLDTNRYSDMAAGDSFAERTIIAADCVMVPFAVLAELRFAFLCGSHREANENALRLFLSKPRVGLLFPDSETCRMVAETRRDLQRKGRVLGVNDLWIAALALQHQLHLFTRDSDFDVLPALLRA